MKFIPSLNGLRAISILMVLFSHTCSRLGLHTTLILFDGQLGVNIFFIISGFLITSLLMTEERNSVISLKNFYVRRSLRILPVYYTLVIVYFILQLCHIFYFTPQSWLTTLTYTKYINWKKDWESAHLWSLSIEEQFYLFWPIVFKYFQKSRKFIVFVLILSVPIIKTYFFVKQGVNFNALLITYRADSLMLGCLLALYNEQLMKIFGHFIANNKNYIFYLFLALITVQQFIPYLSSKFALHLESLVTLFGGSIGLVTNLILSIIIFISVNNLYSGWFKLLNSKLFNFIGKLSYSIYIWQQMFFSAKLSFSSNIPLVWLCILIFALLSHKYIETPFIKIKDRFKKAPPATQHPIAATIC